jgi:hypothetical protein
MNWLESRLSASGVNFSSGVIATKMAEGLDHQVKLLRRNNLNRKSESKPLTVNPAPFE